MALHARTLCVHHDDRSGKLMPYHHLSLTSIEIISSAWSSAVICRHEPDCESVWPVGFPMTIHGGQGYSSKSTGIMTASASIIIAICTGRTITRTKARALTGKYDCTRDPFVHNMTCIQQ